MLKITHQKRNDLLQREEIYALKDDVKTPGMEDIRKEIASLLKKDSTSVAVKRIKGRFGSKQFIVEAYAYDNEEVMKKTEPKVKEKKGAAKAAESPESKGESK